MKEQLYTIPVNEAFALDCECPVCAMHHKLKEDALDFTTYVNPLSMQLFKYA